jgi:hypothetical protein
MKIKDSLLLVLFSSAWGSAPAHDARCDAPPYGDTPAGWSIAQSGLKNIQQLLAKHPALANEKITSVIRKACEAKFDGGDRSSFYEVGMTDQDFAIRPPEVLAMQYLGTKMALQDAKRSDMNIYALFMCFSTTNACKLFAPARMSLGLLMPAQTFTTVADCESYAEGLAQYPKDTDGHFMAPFGWYECRGKHVETWEPTR